MIAFVLSACSDGSSDVAEPEPDTTPPDVALAASDTLVLDEGSVTLTATATDDGGSRSSSSTRAQR